MSNPIPNLLALTSIADGSAQQAAPIRNNYSLIQTAVNALIAAFSGGASGQVLKAVDTETVEWATLGTRGTAVITWPGGASLSSGVVVTHGLGTTPTAVIATMNAIVSGVAVICPIQVTNIGATTFQLFAQTIDGSTPANGSSIDVSWWALA